MRLDIPLDSDVDTDAIYPVACPLPGRAPTPVLVDPREIKRRSIRSREGLAVLIHALAHIEANAINLALDIVWRFPCMPEKFYRDWISVAHEEAYHHGLLALHLQSLGYCYGDFPAHNGLWEMAEKTSDDLLARLALVPRTLEARGLDVSPVIRAKLHDAGDTRGAEILDIILRDEIGHVAIGNHWYRYLCAHKSCDPIACIRGTRRALSGAAFARAVQFRGTPCRRIRRRGACRTACDVTAPMPGMQQWLNCFKHQDKGPQNAAFLTIEITEFVSSGLVPNQPRSQQPP